jgi:hypothetical protein
LELLEVKECFQEHGYDFLYKRFSKMIDITGIFNDLSEDVLAAFLSSFEFNEEHKMFFDDFTFQFLSFQTAFRHNELDFSYYYETFFHNDQYE